MKRDVLAKLSGAPRAVDLDGDRVQASGWIGGFEDLGLLGQGGMGEVRRVRDPDLGRVMAMKILRAPLLREPAALARFVAEAQATAQLVHPGIVPVHELGRLEDGRVWFTMREVRGRTLGAVIAEVHAASAGDRWASSPSGWTLRRLVESLHDVCQAVAFAHHRGVVHRDLKPDNVMVGDYGEVLVLDWGLARVRGHDLEDGVETVRSHDDAHRTRTGTVAGTPAYMPPEQARGDVEAIDARSDVYALGAILYEILSGRAPYEGSSSAAVLRQVLSFPPDPPGRVSSPTDTFTFGPDAPEAPTEGPPLPRELVDACTRAMSREREPRHEDAAALADDIRGWLEGSRRHEHAMALVRRADEVAEDALRCRVRGAHDRARAERLLAAVAPTAPEAEKRPGWDLEDAASASDREGDLLLVSRVKLLHAALVTHADLPEAHARLAWIQRHRARRAEDEGAEDDALRERELFRTHALALPADHADREPHLAWLAGDGRVTLVTEPAGVEVELRTFVRHGRRLVAEPRGELGRTPLLAVPIPMGSHLLVLRGPHGEVRYPVRIDRGAHWDGVPPDTATPAPIALVGPLDPGVVHVPAGWFLGGGGDGRPATRLWLDGFLVGRDPVTEREYAAFLAELPPDEAQRRLPRREAGGSDDRPLPITCTGSGFSCERPDAPMTSVSCEDALAFAAWRGEGWRPVSGLEREKAARGVDGRAYPWGDLFDPGFAPDQCGGLRRAADVGAWPFDESVYGVRGLAGNTSDWCPAAWSGMFRWRKASAGNLVRGGEFTGTAWEARADVQREVFSGDIVRPERGFRLARDLVPRW